MTQPTWMITGSNGFLGANAAAYLETRATVIGITRQQHDLTKPASLAQEIAETKPDYLLHTAAIADHTLCEERPDLAEAVNAEATKVIARACEDAGTKLIYISTDAVFSGQPTATKPAGNYLETDPPLQGSGGNRGCRAGPGNFGCHRGFGCGMGLSAQAK